MVDTLRPPLEVVASWPKPNYIDPENRGPGLVYGAIVLATFGLLIVTARVYSRLWITKAFGIDDLLIVFAFSIGLALTILIIIGNRSYHSGYHIWDIRPETAAPHRLNVWASQWCYLFSTGAVKISVLLFYRRLSVSFTQIFWWATWIGIVYNILNLVAFCIALTLVCRPVEAYWMSFDRIWATENHGKYYCSSEGVSLTVSTVFSIVGDFYAALLPSLLVLKLNMARKQKIAVASLFAVAYLVVGAGIGRSIMLNRVVMHDYDFTWTLWEAWIWSLLELWIGLLAASAPALKPFCRQFLFSPMSNAVSTARNPPNGENGSSKPPSATKRDIRQSWNVLPPMMPQFDKGSSSPELADSSMTKSGASASVWGAQHHHRNSSAELHDLEQGSISLHTWENRVCSLNANRCECQGNAQCQSPASSPVQRQHPANFSLPTSSGRENSSINRIRSTSPLRFQARALSDSELQGQANAIPRTPPCDQGATVDGFDSGRGATMPDPLRRHVLANPDRGDDKYLPAPSSRVSLMAVGGTLP
ncbi:uncharacterized protein HMPREF1541_04758 [Cyphellophora europaea CBS 101466]|uniref:Rhodopsin domain-containing protein n=1 Tax=Cyphellophora europaea (strain CBS 101466) TaxID=1220924 RepID=W2RVF1_CYPE1|nr:uncharacterized protein HMPREF1541_04758 [Cyphellophora europaea CBS 101466]ETN40481.1 hypothetical protein HMPREF1541_04758 [Cyphellophora europaea CBS 101466]